MPNNKQRREAERRRLQRQLERRRERAVARRRTTLIISIVGTVVLIGAVTAILFATLGGNSTPQAGSNPKGFSTSEPSLVPSGIPQPKTPPVTTPPSSASSATSAASGTCTFTKSGTAARTVSLPPSNPPTKGTVTEHVVTNQGALTFVLDRATTPCTTANFVSLATQKYFDNTSCHRLTTSGIYVLQCGDPTGTGSGGPGYEFNDELTGKEKYTTGVLAMANAGPNTNGSQFFIVYKNSQLGPNYTVFGHVTKGLDVVDKVAAKGVQGGGTDGKPALPVTIKSVTSAG